MVYGLELPFEIYSKYAFAEKLKEVDMPLPKVYMILKNRLTQYMGAASAYATVLQEIDKDVLSLLKTYTDMFAFKTLDMGIIDVRDFQTTGVVSAARGCPLRKLKSGRLELMGKRVTVREEYRQNCIDNIETIVTRMSKEL